MIDCNGVYWEWYVNTSWSGTQNKKNVTSNLYYLEPGGFNWISLSGGDDNYTAHFQSTIRHPTNVVYIFYVEQDNGARTIIDNVIKADNYGVEIVTIDTFTMSLNAIQSYSLVIYLIETYGGSYYDLYWSTSTISKQIIPKNY